MAGLTEARSFIFSPTTIGSFGSFTIFTDFTRKLAELFFAAAVALLLNNVKIHNAKINNVNNTEFYAGDVEIVLDDLIKNKGITADIVMFDPPRKGLDRNTINNILMIKPKKIVYISCNPATLIRDLALFEELYEIKTIVPVDMFPWTSHVECVAVLQLRQNI